MQVPTKHKPDHVHLLSVTKCLVCFHSGHQQTTDTERKLAAMGLSSSADFVDYGEDLEEPQSSQVIAPMAMERTRTPSPNPTQLSSPPPAYSSVAKTTTATTKVTCLHDCTLILLTSVLLHVLTLK